MPRGGARPNSGGKRPGAGRKPAAPPSIGTAVDATPDAGSPLAFLLSVMNDKAADPRLRVRAAVAAAQYTHAKRGENTKREDVATKAKQAEGGRFSAAQPPRLVVNN